MNPLDITKEAFTVPRTPLELSEYVSHAYQQIAENKELINLARLHKEPYKTFVEELMLFSNFCTWKYGQREDVLCALVSGTPGRDAIIIDKRTWSKHSVEITWPIDGQAVVQQNKILIERTYSEIHICDLNDLSQHNAAIDLILKIANKKALRDYRDKAESTIMFVFDRSLFWDENPKHMKLIESLKDHLSDTPLKVDSILLMIVFGKEKKIIKVKNTG